jgi:hypothetical protein
MDLTQVWGDELNLALQEIGLKEDEAANLLGRIGLQEQAARLDIGGWAPGPGGFDPNAPDWGLVKTPGRIGLAEAGVGGAIDYLSQTLTDVDFDESKMTRDLATLADQISMTDLQKTEIGFQREDLSDYDTISEALLTAREALLGTEAGVGEERIGLERQQTALEEESTELQADRAMRGALRESYARGASFTTGIREDVSDLNRVKGLALDELALRRTGLDVSSRELVARTGYQQSEIDAARNRAELDLDQNMRALDMDESEVGFFAERLGRSVTDVADAITRLDTDRLSIQLQISNQVRELEALGLERDEVAIRLEGLGYDRADVGLTLEAYALQRGGLELDARTAAANDTLKQLAVERGLRGVESERNVAGQRQDEFANTYEQWEDMKKATEEYKAGELLKFTEPGGILEMQAGLGATQAVTEAIQQWAPVLAGITRGELAQLSTLSGQIPGLEQLATGAELEPQMRWAPGMQDININFPDINIPDYPDYPDFGGMFEGFFGGDEGGVDEPFDDGFVPRFPGDVPPVDDVPGDGGDFKPPGPGFPPGYDPGTMGPFEQAPPVDVFPSPGGPGFPPDYDPGTMGPFSADEQAYFDAAVAAGFFDNTGGQRVLAEQAGANPDFATALLESIGAPVSANNLDTLGAWMSAEGTSAANNPLATTKQGGQLGDVDREQYDAFNPTGVKNYPDFATGVDRTAATLQDSFALPILEALMADVPAAVMNTDHAVNTALGKWSGGGYWELPGQPTAAAQFGPAR